MAWEEVKLKEVTAFIKRGISPKYVEENGYKIINQKCINFNTINYEHIKFIDKSQKVTKEKYLKNGDILVNSTGTGTLGRTVQIKEIIESIFCDTHVTIVRSNDRINQKFLAIQLKIYEPLIENLGKGSTNQIELSASDLSHLKIKLPPLETQQKIVNLISNYDDLIENNNKRIRLLEQSAEELYKEWFVRLRFPNYQNIKIEDGIPEGWEKKKIESICNVGRGSSPRPITDSKYFENGDIPWLKIADATASFIYIYKTKEYVNEYGASFSRKLPKDSLIIAASGTLGFPMFLATECCIHDGWMYFIDLDKSLRIYFYYSLIYLKEYFNNQSYGAAIQNINTNIVKKSTITIPKKEILDNFNEIVIPIFDEIQLLQQKNQAIKETRDLLLPRLISGKLDIEKLDIN